MGYQLHTQLQEHSPIVAAFHRSGELLFKRMINPLLASDFIFQRTGLWRELRAQLEVIHTLMEQVIEQRAMQLQAEQEQEKLKEKEEEEEQHRPRMLLDLLLLAKQSRKQIRDEVNTFVFAVSVNLSASA